MTLPSGKNKVSTPKEKDPGIPKPGNKPRPGIKSGDARKKVKSLQDQGPKLFSPDVVSETFDQLLIYDMLKKPAMKGYNPIIEVMWSDVDKIVPDTYIKRHLSKEMRYEKFKAKIGQHSSRSMSWPSWTGR